MHVDNRELFLCTLIMLHYKNTKNCSKRIIDLKTIAKSMSIMTAGFMFSPLSPQPRIHQTHTHFNFCMVEVISAPHFYLRFSSTETLLSFLYSGNTSFPV